VVARTGILPRRIDGVKRADVKLVDRQIVERRGPKAVVVPLEAVRVAHYAIRLRKAGSQAELARIGIAFRVLDPWP